ncbi:oligopeptide ABC transporter substrate-binding protein [Ornithinibacillus bavariensis]|uniref:Peptide ABC transporter substrate-binding protein n=1 Tax=Ornithinibacillus bavariensis TaxID=545502 RepID=A0A920C735_9BACI|nr:oligopeptide ABC transporter substrate-binding protein [Ornithinibacillus bavariensis]GIO26754.1 peptide ABC transporter substrate-binding protein [Ornithinibacillus bavariensis]HAM80797.1 oligopeptide ABC transporter substrate-binding protein [Ornithinibacillus sp.]
MRKTSKWLLSLMLVLLLALAACGGGDDNKSDKKSDNKASENKASEDGTFNIEDFSMTTSNDGKPIENGNLTYGVVSDTVFEGTFNFNFYQAAPDYEVIAWFDEPLFDNDENYAYTQTGAATWEVDDSGKVYTLKIKDGVNWQDGEPVTAEDWAFAYEVIGNKAYKGIRYGSDFENVVGMKEYHEGKADSISGIKVMDEKTLQITFQEGGPSLITGGIWPYALPKHIFGDMDIAKMAESDVVRKNPIGIGPYKVESIVPGESVTLVKNENYWRGEPALEKVTVKVVSPSTVVQELKTGGVDMVDSFPTDQFVDNANMSNVEFLGQVENSYTYIGFKLGKWDAKKGEVVVDPNAKMADVNLRRAMWYAVDNDAVGKKFYNGLRWNATTLIIPFFPEYHNPDIETPTFDPEKAKQILDEAGYKDVDGDGLRENPKGEELVINFASMSGGDTAEPLAQYYIQSWKNVGLNVQLVDGRLIEFNTFYDRLEADDPAYDIYQGAWGTGTDVNPSGIFAGNSSANYPRWTNEENEKLLKDGASMKAMDPAYRKEVYDQWQQLMVDNIPLFPTLYRAVIVPVNDRVVNFTLDPASDLRRYQIGVTAEKPAVEK